MRKDEIVKVGLLIIAGCFLLALKWFAAHGHLEFRSHMIEDWLVWGLAAGCFLAASILIIKAIKRSA
jgi:hypothetical protein